MSRPNPARYQNPVYPHSSPDPFVLKHGEDFWAYVTGIQPDGRCFGILHSQDLVHWTPAGSAMDPLPGGHTCYWAPEVVYENGWFHLYYSVGNETHMEIRVAHSDRPTGPFRDLGRRLTKEDFAIDPHVFVDEDGRWYLFYAADFYDHPRVGTGTVMDRMDDPYTLSGHPRPVTRARYDWQIYDPQREAKGGVRWHTLEGPFVLKHGGAYYQMFSGGNWHDAGYGVSYGVTGSLDRPEEWTQMADGETSLPILRSRPEDGIIGPGHNSVVRGPDNRELFCVYHRWDLETQERVMAIDRLDWEDGRLVLRGPTADPQPGPSLPDLAGWSLWRCTEGRCSIQGGALHLEPLEARAESTRSLLPSDWLLELHLRASGPHFGGQLGLELIAVEGADLRFTIDPISGIAMLSGAVEREFRLPSHFDPAVPHLLRVEAAGGQVTWTLDHYTIHHAVPFDRPIEHLRLFAHYIPADFSAFALTYF